MVGRKGWGRMGVFMRRKEGWDRMGSSDADMVLLQNK